MTAADQRGAESGGQFAHFQFVFVHIALNQRLNRLPLPILEGLELLDQRPEMRPGFIIQMLLQFFIDANRPCCSQKRRVGGEVGQAGGAAFQYGHGGGQLRFKTGQSGVLRDGLGHQRSVIGHGEMLRIHIVEFFRIKARR